MPTYAYQVKNQQGKDLTGQREAVDVNVLIQELKDQGFLIIKVQETKSRAATRKVSRGRKRIKLDDLLVFSRQMATMVDAGIPLVQTLDILSEQTENPSFRKIIQTIKGDVESGKNFSDGLETHRRVFSPLFISMVRAGETSGTLDEILDRLATYLEKMSNLQKKIKSAMIYPCVVFGIAITITTLMLVFIIPKFAEIFQSLDAKLPAPTQILIDVSNSVRKNFLLVVGCSIALFFLFRAAIQSPGGRVWWDRFKLRMPVFGALFLKSAISKFSRTLSTLVKSGVPILTALEIVGTTAGNRVIELALTDVKNSIREGEGIAGPLEKKKVFPPMVVRMVAVGEETGELEEMLVKISDFYDAQVDATVDGLSSLLEPLIIAFLGVVIGGIVIAMFLPIFNLSQAIKM
ncbi:MAG: type II secretion system F family protein [Candidatus Omnitrophica bacterium]|nr:type II secretion system F family protein [Candidatus Omnitrophota bacterium]